MNDNVMIPFKLLHQTIQLLERIDMDDYCEADQFDYENIFAFLNTLKTYHEELRQEYDLILYFDDGQHHLTKNAQPQQDYSDWGLF